jgi:hypothetical protein
MLHFFLIRIFSSLLFFSVSSLLSLLSLLFDSLRCLGLRAFLSTLISPCSSSLLLSLLFPFPCSSILFALLVSLLFCSVLSSCSVLYTFDSLSMLSALFCSLPSHSFFLSTPMFFPALFFLCLLSPLSDLSFFSSSLIYSLTAPVNFLPLFLSLIFV